MPYLTNNQRMDLGLEGACCVKEETLEKKKPEGYYVEGAVEKRRGVAWGNGHARCISKPPRRAHHFWPMAGVYIEVRFRVSSTHP